MVNYLKPFHCFPSTHRGVLLSSRSCHYFFPWVHTVLKLMCAAPTQRWWWQTKVLSRTSLMLLANTERQLIECEMMWMKFTVATRHTTHSQACERAWLDRKSARNLWSFVSELVRHTKTPTKSTMKLKNETSIIHCVMCTVQLCKPEWRRIRRKNFNKTLTEIRFVF